MKWRSLLPVGYVYWAWDISWSTYPFRVLYLGFWLVSHDRSGRWFERWPHVHVNWNDSIHN
jgi:hypothetical protein